MLISTELMDDYKNMTMAMPEKRMTACSDGKNKTLYSIGSDGHFYLLHENLTEHKGWEKINLTAELAKQYSGHVFEIKTFDVRKRNEKYQAVFVAEIDQKPELFYGEGKTKESFIWNQIPFDVQGKTCADIVAVYLSAFDKIGYVICDIKQTIQKEELTRYFVDCKAKENAWKEHPLPADFTITKQSSVGRSGNSKVDGIYTLGSLGKEHQLLYCPFYNRFKPELPPLPIRFEVKKQIDAIAVSERIEEAKTDLFACGSGTLYLYPGDQQRDLCNPKQLLKSEVFQKVEGLQVQVVEKRVVISGLNQQGQLFYCSAPFDKQEDAKAWGQPEVVASNMAYADYTADSDSQSESFFGVKKDGKYLQIIEKSKQTGIWREKSILLPAMEGIAQKVLSYITRIQIKDAENVFCASQKLKLRTQQLCSVYINGQYYQLDKEPTEIYCDEFGKLQIIEEAAGLYGTEITVELEGISKVVRPSREPIQRLFELDTPEKLKAARVEGEKLIGDCEEEQIAAISKTLSQIGKSEAAKQLLSGDVQLRLNAGIQKRRLSAIELQGESKEMSGIVLAFGNGELKKAEQAEQVQILSLIDGTEQITGRVCLALDESAVSLDSWDVIYTTANEFFEEIKRLGEEAFKVVISCVEDVWNFTLKVGKIIYTFVIDTLEKLGAGLLKLLEYIKVEAKKLLQYLKYIFDWEDIKKVADTLQTAVLHGFDYMEDEITECQKQIHGIADTITGYLDAWAEIEHKDVMENSLKRRTGNDTELDVRQSYLLDCCAKNAEQGVIKKQIKTSFTDKQAEQFQKCMQNLFLTMETQDVILDDFLEKIKKELLDAEKLKEMSFGDICKKILAIIGDGIIYTLENVMEAVLEAVKLLLEQIKLLLSTPIHIPIVSNILLEVFGIEEKSILQISCLVLSAAIVPGMKLCGQGDLLKDEVLEQICKPQKTQSISKKNSLELKSVAEDANLPVTKTEHEAYAALHITCGIVNTCETFVAVKCQMQKPKVAGESAIEESFSVWDIADAVLSVIDGGCYISAFFIYQPCQLISKNWVKIYNMIFGTVKYGGLACKISNKLSGTIVSILGGCCTSECCETMQNILGSNKLKKAGEFVNAIGAGFLILGDIFYMVWGTEGKNDNEKELLYLDCSSLIGDNIRVIMDNIIPYVEEPETKGILVGVRAFFSIVYSGLQIAEGANALGMPAKAEA